MTLLPWFWIAAGMLLLGMVLVIYLLDVIETRRRNARNPPGPVRTPDDCPGCSSPIRIEGSVYVCAHPIEPCDFRGRPEKYGDTWV